MENNNDLTPEQLARAKELLAMEQTAQNAAEPTPERVNPLIAKARLPGETFTLPSGALFYNNGELTDEAKIGAEVHVFPMTVIDEIVLKTPDMLFSGKAVNDVFSRCIPSVVKPDQLLARDVDYLLLCLRKVSYGNFVELTTSHTGCKKSKTEVPPEHVYPVDVSTFIQQTKRIDPTTIEHDFTVTLENGQVVIMNPVRYGDYIAMMQASDQSTDMSVELQVKTFAQTLAGVITSVDNTTNREDIVEWLSHLTPSYVTKLNSSIEAGANWGPDNRFKVSCKDCDETLEVVAPMNPLAFFT